MPWYTTINTKTRAYDSWRTVCSNQIGLTWPFNHCNWYIPQGHVSFEYELGVAIGLVDFPDTLYQVGGYGIVHKVARPLSLKNRFRLGLG